MIRLRTVLPVLVLVPAFFGLPAHAQTACTSPFDCDDFNDCTVDACDLVSGTCAPPTAVQDGTSCSDANECTDGDTCASGTCVGGAPVAGCVPCLQNDDCDDGNPCTDDVCDLGRCDSQSGGDGNPCDDGDPCTDHDVCRDGSCEGEDMTCDDGMACTDDSCDEGACVHEPVNELCVAPNECAEAACRPDDPSADAQGCVSGAGNFDLMECAEDDNPCTVDRCRNAACAHDPLENFSGCTPLVPSYRNAVMLRKGVGRLMAYLADEVDVGGDTGGELLDQLDVVAADLGATVLVLAGRDAGPIPSRALPLGLSHGQPSDIPITTAQQRGRVALAWLRGTPKHVEQFLAITSAGRRRGDLDAVAARELRRNGRILLADTKALKRNVKNLQKTFSVFQR